ncbi:hypothetical protein LSAT2_002676, partial [Lamellibrachia satsuma]
MLSSTYDKSDLLNGCGMLITSEHTGSRRSEETPKFASEDTPDELCRSTQNPKQNTLAKCSGARSKSGGKLHTFPILENPKESKKKMRRRCETEVVMLEASFMPHLEDAATAVITESIVNEKARLAAECSEVALGDGGGGVRVVLGRGCAVARLLMPDEYRTVVITDASDDAEVLDALVGVHVRPVRARTPSRE